MEKFYIELSNEFIKSGLTHRELAKKIGYKHEKSIYDFLSGRRYPPRDKFEKLCEVLNVSSSKKEEWIDCLFCKKTIGSKSVETVNIYPKEGNDNLLRLKHYLIQVHESNYDVQCEACKKNSIKHAHIVDAHLKYRKICLNCLSNAEDLFKYNSVICLRDIVITEYFMPKKINERI